MRNLYIILLISHLAGFFLWIPTDTLFNSDEIGLAYDILGRLNGLPPEYCAWPGGTVQFFNYGIVLFYVGIKTLFESASIAGFSKVLANAYFDFNSIITIVRIVNLAILFSALLLLFNFFKSKASLKTLSIIAIFIISVLFNSTITLYLFTATSESLAFSFALLSLGFLKFSDSKHKQSIAGVCLGLSIASKITFAVVALYALYIVFEDKKNVKSILIFLVIVAISFLFVCPYLWTDTIRILKSILGNLARSGAPVGMSTALKLFVNTTGILLPIAFVSLSFVNYSKRNIIEFVVCLVGILFVVLSSAKSSVTYDRYILPASVMMIVFVISKIQVLDFNKSSYKYYIIAFVCFIQAAFGLNNSVSKIQKSIAYSAEIQNIQKTLANGTDTLAVLAPYDLLSHIAKYGSKKTFMLWQQKLTCDKRNIDFFMKAGIDSSSYQVINYALSDQEIGLTNRLKIYSAFSQGRMNIQFYSFNTVQENRYALTPNKIVFEELKNKIIILENKDLVLLKENQIKSNMFSGSYYSIVKL